MNNDDFIKIVNDVKSMEYIDGRFYRNGWNNACDAILDQLNELIINQKLNLIHLNQHEERNLND